MSVEKDREWIQLPTGGAVYQATKGEPHHSFYAKAMARNLNYALEHRVPQMLVAGNGHHDDDGTNAITCMWGGGGSDLLFMHGRAPVHWPHSNDLTIGYAIRAGCALGGGSFDIYICDRAWPDKTAPGDCQYVKETVSPINNATYNTGTGTANGAYTGTIAVTWPKNYESMVYIYVLSDSGVHYGHWCFWTYV